MPCLLSLCWWQSHHQIQCSFIYIFLSKCMIFPILIPKVAGRRKTNMPFQWDQVTLSLAGKTFRFWKSTLSVAKLLCWSVYWWHWTYHRRNKCRGMKERASQMKTCQRVEKAFPDYREHFPQTCIWRGEGYNMWT